MRPGPTTTQSSRPAGPPGRSPESIIVGGLLVGALTRAQAAAAAAATCGRASARRGAVSPPNATAQPRLTEVAAIAMKATTQRIPYSFGGGHGTAPGNPANGLDCQDSSVGVCPGRMELPAGSGESVRRSGASSRPAIRSPATSSSSARRPPTTSGSTCRRASSSTPPTRVVRRPAQDLPRGAGLLPPQGCESVRSQPLRAQGHRIRHGQVRDRRGRRWGPGQRVHRPVVQSAGDGACRTNSRGRVSIAVLTGRYCVALTSVPHGSRKTGKVVVNARGGTPISVSIRAPVRADHRDDPNDRLH